MGDQERVTIFTIKAIVEELLEQTAEQQTSLQISLQSLLVELDRLLHLSSRPRYLQGLKNLAVIQEYLASFKNHRTTTLTNLLRRFITQEKQAHQNAEVAASLPITIVIEHNGQEKTFATVLVEDRAFVIGRKKEMVDLLIKDPRLSRRHSQLELSHGKVVLKDLNSKNGTFINNKRVLRVHLSDGDSFTIGEAQIRIFIGVKPVPAIYSSKVSTPKQCRRCGTELAPELFLSKRALFWQNRPYCIACLCRGEFDLPTLSDRYCLVERIGGGGTGDVYLGLHRLMQRPVAIKILKYSRMENKLNIERFWREGRIVGELMHPNLVNVLDVCEDRGTYFMVMEYIDGGSAKDKLVQTARFSTAETLEIGLAVLRALDYAFDQNIVHRDIKPANILMTRKGRVVLSDFGLAKHFSQGPSNHLTVQGAFVGTLYYMAPEQILDPIHVDQRADIYSVGATLYHFLTGVPPFKDNDHLALAHKILNDEPAPIHAIRPEIPQALENAISKAMRKEPEERYQTPAEFISVLERIARKIGDEAQITEESEDP